MEGPWSRWSTPPAGWWFGARDTTRQPPICFGKSGTSARCRHDTAPRPPRWPGSIPAASTNFPPLFRLVAGSGGPPVSRTLACHPRRHPFKIHRGGKFMTNASRVPVIRLLFLGVLVLAPTVWAQQRPPIAEQIAKTHGLDSFGQIEQIRYTFNADSSVFKVSRAWVWNPNTDEVSYEGKDKAGKPVKATYLRSQLGSQAALVKEEIDPAFLNDQYWLLFPLHLSRSEE